MLKILEFNQYHKSDKAPFVFYADLEFLFLIEKIHGCKNNPEKLYTTKVSKHIISGFSMSTIECLQCLQYNSRNHLKMQEIILLVKKSLKINILKIKKYKVGDDFHYTSKYRAAGVPSLVFHNRSNNDYHFVIKKLAEKFEEKFSYST